MPLKAESMRTNPLTGRFAGLAYGFQRQRSGCRILLCGGGGGLGFTALQERRPGLCDRAREMDWLQADQGQRERGFQQAPGARAVGQVEMLAEDVAQPFFFQAAHALTVVRMVLSSHSFQGGADFF